MIFWKQITAISQKQVLHKLQIILQTDKMRQVIVGLFS
jgi:hypothetical protein